MSEHRETAANVYPTDVMIRDSAAINNLLQRMYDT